MAFYPAYYYDPSESNGAYDENTLAGCVSGGEGYEKVDSYETNNVYLLVNKDSIPNGATISKIAVSFKYKQLTYENKTGLFYSSKLSWSPVVMTSPVYSGTKVTSWGSVTDLASASQVASGIGASSTSYTSKSVSANVSATKSSNNIVGIKFVIDSDNASDVHFWFNSVSIDVTYSLPTHTITVNASPTNGGTIEGTGTYEYGSTATVKAIPNTGYKFAGWANQSGVITVTTNPYSFTVNNDTTFSAVFDLSIYTITLNNQSATSAGTSTIYLKYSAGWYSNSAATTSISSITIPKKTGYTFGGYYTSTNGEGTPIINSSGAIVGSKTYIAENDTLYAYWTKNTYSIHFNSNGGTGSIQSQTDIAYDASINLTINNGSITKFGYNFSGWNTEADGSGTPYANGASVSKLAGSSKTGDSITLYAQWSAKTPTITFNPNGGSVSPTSKSVTYGQSYGTLPTPTKEHYDFNGWYYNGAKVVSSTIVNEENAHTLVASWTPKTYTLIYDARGGTINPASKEVEYGSKYGELPTPQKVGHTFNGWWTAADGGDRVSSETIMTEDNQIIYAHWTLNIYTITFDGNGADNTGAMIAQQFSYGETKKLTKNVFTKEFYNFVNWKDETGKEYADEEEITYLTESNKTLAAQWEKGFLGQIIIGDNNYQVIKILIDVDKIVDKVYLDKNLTFWEE